MAKKLADDGDELDDDNGAASIVVETLIETLILKWRKKNKWVNKQIEMDLYN